MYCWAAAFLSPYLRDVLVSCVLSGKSSAVGTCSASLPHSLLHHGSLSGSCCHVVHVLPQSSDLKSKLSNTHSSTLEMAAVCSAKTSVNFCWTTWLHIPEISTLLGYRCKNLKSKLIRSLFYTTYNLYDAFSVIMVQKEMLGQKCW
jgi:hypothetical protein